MDVGLTRAPRFERDPDGLYILESSNETVVKMNTFIGYLKNNAWRKVPVLRYYKNLLLHSRLAQTVLLDWLAMYQDGGDEVIFFLKLVLVDPVVLLCPCTLYSY